MSYSTRNRRQNAAKLKGGDNKLPLDLYFKHPYSIYTTTTSRDIMDSLYYITFAVNFVALIAAFWLGLYVITRSPRAPTAWLTAFTLWSLGGLFLNILLALNPPPAAPYRPSGLRFLFPFWPSGTFEQGASAWLQGWSVAPAVVFWHHATLLMRPGKMNPWRWTRVIIGYVTAIAAVEVQAFTQILFSVEGGDPLYLNSLRAGSLYSIFGIMLVILTTASIVNLARSARVAPTKTARRQLWTLVIATVIAGLTGPVSIVASWLDLFPVPMVVMSGLLAIFVGMVGFGVARYSALVEGRTMARDFVYNLALIVIVTCFYLLAVRTLVLAYQAPLVLIILIPILAIFSHSLMSIAYRLTDRLFYRQRTWRLRSNLQRLSRLAGEGEDLHENLNETLKSLCASVRATYGLIFTCDGEWARIISDFRWRDLPIELPAQTLFADDFLHLEARHLPEPLDEAALLVPLYAESEQVGALVLGQPTNGVRFADDDVESILHPADRIADVIYISKRKEEYMSRLAALTEEHRSHTTSTLPSIPVDSLEDALRNLYDYAYLADTPLADMQLIRKKLAAGQKTHLERGKTVYSVVVEALEHLRPVGDVPPEPLPREWYPFTILHNAYLDNVPNRDIMSKLYISEGTFNRTRRAAIRTLARELAEMEHLI
jgi:hypothetical protein